MKRKLELIADRRVTTKKKSIAILALALGLAAATAPTAATAKSRATQARAQATENVMDGGAGVSPERVRALQECNARIVRFRGYNALGMPTALYRTCMNQHGQPE